MAIIAQGFETLITNKGTEKCDFGELLERSRQIKEQWQNSIVINENGTNFNLDKDLKFHYMTDYGKKKEADISEFAFSQLCSRMGVPANYIKKCFANGKEDLTIQNFRAWANDTENNLLVRENDGVVRAVLSDSYTPFDSYQVLRALKYTVDFKRWQPTQVYLSEDRLVVRFVDFTPIPVNDGSPLYLGFTVSSSDVGRGSLNAKMMIYRSVCTNGLLISSMGGTLYKQHHIGEAMSESKLNVFNKMLADIDTIGSQIVGNISTCRKETLKDYEMKMYLEKAKREMKLSEKSMEKLQDLISGTYEPTKWGIINGVTELAQDFTLETRLDMEHWAGEFFAKTA